MSVSSTNFARANFLKILSIPLFITGWLLSLVIPRSPDRWVLGSAIGVGEGAYPLAVVISEKHPNHKISWILDSEDATEKLANLGIEAVRRTHIRSLWHTLRAGHIIVTHGLGDVNRFGVFRGEITHLVHGAPLKRLHLDSIATTSFRGPSWLTQLLKRMYLIGGKQFSLIVAGSQTAANRLRSAYRVLPGKVKILGDPRDDIILQQIDDPSRRESVRRTIHSLILGTESVDQAAQLPKFILYAPTWRDGAANPVVPDDFDNEMLAQVLRSHNAYLLIRSHPLGDGQYGSLLGDRVKLFGSELATEITPLLTGFDLLITDYSSIAIDFSLCNKPILWFVPDADSYSYGRGLYEPIEVTAIGKAIKRWDGLSQRINSLITKESSEGRLALLDAKHLKQRFHTFQDGASAERVYREILRLSIPDAERIPENSIFFESFFGNAITCNPAAIDREIALEEPQIPRFWSIMNEQMILPAGAVGLLVGSPEWFAARRRARVLIVNDWLRFNFSARKGQLVFQTWHGTMLKNLALSRPNVSLRTRLAIRRESKRWDLLLSQNPHSSEHFRQSYAYTGEILELGYPRTDELSQSLAGQQRSPIRVASAKRKLGVPEGARVLSYAPTWRDNSADAVDAIDVEKLADVLGSDWVVVARGHSRTTGSYPVTNPRIVDASGHPEINDVIIASDLFVTDYSSSMFDAAVAKVPQAFFVPDLEDYRDRERGFTFPFPEVAPGPLCDSFEEIVELAKAIEMLGSEGSWVHDYQLKSDHFRELFTPYDDGYAGQRVVEELRKRGLLDSQKN